MWVVQPTAVAVLAGSFLYFTVFGGVTIDKPGYLPAHLFAAQMLLAKTNVTLQEIHTAEQHLKNVVALDPRSFEPTRPSPAMLAMNPSYQPAQATINRLLQVYNADQPEVHEVIAE